MCNHDLHFKQIIAIRILFKLYSISIQVLIDNLHLLLLVVLLVLLEKPAK